MAGTADTQGDLEAALLERVNADRMAHGLAPVTFDPELLTVARARAAAQAGQAALSHNDRRDPLESVDTAQSAGTTATTGVTATATPAFTRLMKEAGVSYYVAGENLARPSATPGTDLAEAAEQALMRSPTHRENILTPGFDRAAVGLARDASGRVIFAQIFRAG